MPKDDIGGGNIIGKVAYIGANKTYVLGDHVYCLRAREGDPRFYAYMIKQGLPPHCHAGQRIAQSRRSSHPAL